jgi:hypothetical protein
MSLRITIDVFSGRPNPVIQLDGREEKEALERLRPTRKAKPGELMALPQSMLGYRGLLIESSQTRGALPKSFRYAHGDVVGAKLSARAADDSFEEFVCGSTGLIRRLGLPKELPATILKEIGRFRLIREKFPRKFPSFPIKRVCSCGPRYEPAWWNDPQRQPVNNCYNYATNYRTDTFAQPGQAAGSIYSALTCAAVRPAAEKDMLVNNPRANNKCPAEGHLVALVIWPNFDFHWYRKGRNGQWTHKPGGTPVTNLDNSGQIITDPRTADRGGYTSFCTFMTVMHGHIKID